MFQDQSKICEAGFVEIQFFSKRTKVIMAVSTEGKAVVSKKSLIIRMYQFPEFVVRKGPIQFEAITFHGPEKAMSRKGGFEW